MKKGLYKLERVWFNMDMEEHELTMAPSNCPVCGGALIVTRLECEACGTEVTGRYTLGHLATLREPFASLIDMFLRVRGNMKEMERELGLSYPTVRARLEEALAAAGFPRGNAPDPEADLHEEIRRRMDEVFSQVNLEERIRERIERGLARSEAARNMAGARARARQDVVAARAEILGRLERGELTAAEATAELKSLNERSR